MKLIYECKRCGAAIATIRVDYVDEHKFGFDCLTSDERADIINMDYASDTMQVKALCDACVDADEGELYAVSDVKKYTVH